MRCAKVDPENKIDYYKIFIVPEADVAPFDAEFADDHTSTYASYKIYPSGNDIDIQLPASQLDVNQNPLSPSGVYRIFVVLVTEDYYPRTSVSYASQPFTLDQPRISTPNIFAHGNEISILLETDLNLPFVISTIEGKVVFLGNTQGKETHVVLESVPAGIYILHFPNTQITAKSFFIKE